MDLAQAQRIKDAVKAEAAGLGFLLAGISAPDEPVHFDRFARWIESGYHAEMAYLAAENALALRKSPARLMENCRSILVLGYPYRPQVFPAPVPASEGRIAAYALQEDYHRLLPERCSQLMNRIQQTQNVSFDYKIFTDSSPILEREIAARAGLGWIGKNSCLIHPQWGSFFLLVEVFMDIWLPPDQPLLFDRCGTCQRCVQACPGECILPDRTLDSSRCLAYLTIEKRGEIPIALRERLGNWVFGCDICQIVCPWNRKTAGMVSQSLRLPQSLPLRELLQLTPEVFNQRFKPTPVERARLRGLLRNTITAAGNSSDATLIPLLMAFEQDPDETLSSHARWAVKKLSA